MADFRLAASSAAATALRAEELMYEAASVYVTVAEAVWTLAIRPQQLNWFFGDRDACRCKGPRYQITEYLIFDYAPRGEFACQTVKSARIHLAATTICGTHKLMPRRKPTAVWMASSSNRIPQAAISKGCTV